MSGTRSIARIRSGSDSDARACKRKYHQTVERELAARNPALQALLNELTRQPMSLVMPSATAESEDNRRLIRESRQGEEEDRALEEVNELAA